MVKNTCSGIIVNSEQVFLLCYIIIHKDKMTNTSSHNKQMEYFMGAERFVQ